MNDNIDPISRIALDYGCKFCGAHTDKFYFGKLLSVNKSKTPDLNNLRCFICGSEMLDGSLYGVTNMLLLMSGSGIESKPLAFMCCDCVENCTIEL